MASRIKPPGPLVPVRRFALMLTVAADPCRVLLTHPASPRLQECRMARLHAPVLAGDALDSHLGRFGPV